MKTPPENSRAMPARSRMTRQLPGAREERARTDAAGVRRGHEAARRRSTAVDEARRPAPAPRSGNVTARTPRPWSSRLTASEPIAIAHREDAAGTKSPRSGPAVRACPSPAARIRRARIAPTEKNQLIPRIAQPRAAPAARRACRTAQIVPRPDVEIDPPPLRRWRARAGTNETRPEADSARSPMAASPASHGGDDAAQQLPARGSPGTCPPRSARSRP